MIVVVELHHSKEHAFCHAIGLTDALAHMVGYRICYNTVTRWSQEQPNGTLCSKQKARPTLKRDRKTGNKLPEIISVTPEMPTPIVSCRERRMSHIEHSMHRFSTWSVSYGNAMLRASVG